MQAGSVVTLKGVNAKLNEELQHPRHNQPPPPVAATNSSVATQSHSSQSQPQSFTLNKTTSVVAATCSATLQPTSGPHSPMLQSYTLTAHNLEANTKPNHSDNKPIAKDQAVISPLNITSHTEPTLIDPTPLANLVPAPQATN